MLSRTADNLFWLSRYVERADYLARILETTSRLSVLPVAYAGDGNEWTSALATAGCLNAFLAIYEKPTAETVSEFLAFSEQNPSSIRRCLETARFNARAVRTALTQEMGGPSTAPGSICRRSTNSTWPRGASRASPSG